MGVRRQVRGQLAAKEGWGTEGQGHHQGVASGVLCACPSVVCSPLLQMRKLRPRGLKGDLCCIACKGWSGDSSQHEPGSIVHVGPMVPNTYDDPGDSKAASDTGIGSNKGKRVRE